MPVESTELPAWLEQRARRATRAGLACPVRMDPLVSLAGLARQVRLARRVRQALTAGTEPRARRATKAK